ncbi:hypothetical protein HY624_01100 [Candidatus Uhrbacteria bacterium]|nr:hypothetical protein [Candidatus Uhrbacteria bacterium]
METEISVTFLQKVAQVLGDTNSGLTGSKIVDAFNDYAERWNVGVPHPEYPGWEVKSKRQAIYESLRAFSPQQQFLIIEELCVHPSFSGAAPSKAARANLKLGLYSKYAHFRPEAETKELDLPLIEETRHWLEKYSAPLKLFNQAKLKYDHGTFERNVLDDLRLALELLLKQVLNNNKPLEKQLPDMGSYLKAHGASPQIGNMFQKMLDCYTNYQNDYVKHTDKLKEEEVEFVFEITASFMKHIIRISTDDRA